MFTKYIKVVDAKVQTQIDIIRADRETVLSSAIYKLKHALKVNFRVNSTVSMRTMQTQLTIDIIKRMNTYM